MGWLWKGIEGPHDIPDWAYRYLVTELKVEPDNLASTLRSVEQLNYEGDRLVRLLRIFDITAFPKDFTLRDFISLDLHPELILYEGCQEVATGRIKLTAGAYKAV